MGTNLTFYFDFCNLFDRTYKSPYYLFFCDRQTIVLLQRFFEDNHRFF